MKPASQILVAVVAVIHLYILVLEMFLWRTKRARTAFGTTEEFAEASGHYGTATASRKILFVQVIPGASALLFVLLAR